MHINVYIVMGFLSSTWTLLSILTNKNWGKDAVRVLGNLIPLILLRFRPSMCCVFWKPRNSKGIEDGEGFLCGGRPIILRRGIDLFRTFNFTNEKIFHAKSHNEGEAVTNVALPTCAWVLCLPFSYFTSNQSFSKAWTHTSLELSPALGICRFQ